jgi:hypothetical protein
MKIQVTVRGVYGKDLIYPADAFAKTFCELIRKKTLDEVDLKNIKSLGFQIEIVPDAENPVLARLAV